MKCQIEVVENKNELGCKSKLTRVEKKVFALDSG
jgi:hypothetical protein